MGVTMTAEQLEWDLNAIDRRISRSGRSFELCATAAAIADAAWRFEHMRARAERVRVALGGAFGA